MAGPTRVLLVDDYADALEMWAFYLRYCGYEVETASDGHQALTLAMTSRPDVAILDVDLPGLSGIDVAKRLRADPVTSGIGLIAATGHSHVVQRHPEAEGLFHSILVKPCEPAVLLEEIQRITGRRAADQTAAPAMPVE